MDLAFFGMQGSGKGTQGIIAAEHYHLEMFETGTQLRKLAKENSELAKKVRIIIEAGHLVPTEIVMEIVEDFLKTHQNSRGIIFDGIPRSNEQALAFSKLMKKYNRQFFGILIEITEETALKRLLSRRVCANCKKVYPENYSDLICLICGGGLEIRKDDNTEAIQTRINLYKNETLPVIKKLAEQSKIIHIDGSKNIEKVTSEVFTKLDPLFEKNNEY